MLLSQDVREASASAIAHADDLLNAARVLEDAYPHLAYHFGVLALEEVGRSSLVVMNELAQRGDAPTRRFEREAQDHVRKLFWALWGPTMGREVITREQIETFQGLAQEIHETRQAGLYYSGVDAPQPRDAIADKDLAQLLSLAEARIGMARNEIWAELDPERAEDMAWFSDATADAESRQQIMSGASMQKLAELGNVRDWIRWLRTEFESAEALARERTMREINRQRPSAEEELDAKYRMKLRFESASHSIRPQPLQRWNDGVDWIKLHAVPTNRRELIAEVTIPKSVPASGIWWAGFTIANQLIVALNMGTLGLFWWQMTEKVTRYYEELLDVETNERLIVERTPALTVEWGNHVLDDHALSGFSLCFGALTTFDTPNQRRPFDHYMTALAFFAKTDVTIQFEANAFEQFYAAMREGARLFGHWDGAGTFGDTFEGLLAPYAAIEGGIEPLIEAGRLLDEGRPQEIRVNLGQVATMKLFTDRLFIPEFRDLFEKQKGSSGQT